MKAQGSKGSLKNNNCYLNILTQVFIKLLNVRLLKFGKISNFNLFKNLTTKTSERRRVMFCPLLAANLIWKIVIFKVTNALPHSADAKNYLSK